MTNDLFTILLLALLGGLMLWSQLLFARWLGAYRVSRRRLVCPVHGSEAVVGFLVDGTGPEVYRDVVECSLLPPGAPISCEKVCRSTSVAPFGTPIA